MTSSLEGEGGGLDTPQNWWHHLVMTWWQGGGGGGLDTPQKWWRHLWTAPKECGETDVPVKVVKGLFSHSGDVALNEYFILTFFNTITGLSLTHCYLWSVEFTNETNLASDMTVCLWLGTKWVMRADCLREPTWLGKYSGSIRDLNNISYFITQNVLLDL